MIPEEMLNDELLRQATEQYADAIIAVLLFRHRRILVDIVPMKMYTLFNKIAFIKMVLF